MDPEVLRERLNGSSVRPVTLRLTDNRVSMAWVDFSKRGAIRVSLDEEFLWAPEKVIDALCRYVRTQRKAAWQVVAEFARRVPERSCVPQARARLRSKGTAYDLKMLRDEVNRAHFGGKVQCRIGWGRHASLRRRRRRRSIRFGSWHGPTRTIRIHPALDRPDVPRAFVRYIVFHEMLHAVVPGEARRGRMLHHTPAFRVLERPYPDFQAMQQLAAELLYKLPQGRVHKRRVTQKQSSNIFG